jgi:hypothetical protein
MKTKKDLKTEELKAKLKIQPATEPAGKKSKSRKVNKKRSQRN